MVLSSITAFFTAVSDCAKATKSSIEHQAERSVAKEDKHHDKAIIYANRAFDLILLNIDYLPEEVKRDFLKLKKSFDRNIA